GALAQALPAAIELALIVLTLIGYPVAFETLSRGRSLGKLALGLRVVSGDGSPVRFRQALARALATVVEFWMTSGAVALISSLLNRQGRRVGDFLAGTVVVQERTGRRPGPVIEMPPPMSGWARVAELSRLPADVAATAHQYLTRYTEFTDQTRYEMGVGLANTVSRYVAPPPPPQASPPEYLAAVLAGRRRREEERLAHLRGGRS
ncbi:RDD family protein, partial [Thermobifida halotolerans]|uniref:RDD family protein n=1 Tax=Thermobifida halotolerans TaxID=483545 RepID=UPI001F16815A